MRHRLAAGRPSRPLAWVLVAILLCGCAWVLAVPPWQVPDENAHFAYLQSVAERGTLPETTLERPIFSSAQALAADRSNADQTASSLVTRPEWSPAVERRWRAESAALTPAQWADGGGYNPAAANPPLYYGYAALAYHTLGAGSSPVGRLAAARLASLLLLLATAALTWALVGELLGRRPLLQMTAAALAGLAPMATFLSAAVTPDALLFPATALVLLLAVRVLRRGLTPARGALLGGALALAILTKAASYALVPAVAVAVLVAAWRARTHLRAALVSTAAAGAALTVPVAAWLLAARALDRPAVNTLASDAPVPFQLRELFSYAWQYYLPALPGMQESVLGGAPQIWGTLLQGAVGRFGWLEVKLPYAVYGLVAAALAAVVALAAAEAWRRRRRLDPAVAVVLVLALGATLAGLHYTEYRSVIATGTPVIQGRYLLPLGLPLAGLAVAAALARLPAPARRPAAGLVLGGLAALQLMSLGEIMARFHA